MPLRKMLNVDHPMALLQTKLNGPRKRSDLITRDRLLERLNAGLSGNVTLVCAPAGFGKTTLIAQWIQLIKRPIAWLSLDEQDNESRVSYGRSLPPCKMLFPGRFMALPACSKQLIFPQSIMSFLCSSMIWLICLTNSSWYWMIIISFAILKSIPYSTC
jgi:hypothetical protein